MDVYVHHFIGYEFGNMFKHLLDYVYALRGQVKGWLSMEAPCACATSLGMLRLLHFTSARRD